MKNSNRKSLRERVKENRTRPTVEGARKRKKLCNDHKFTSYSVENAKYVNRAGITKGEWSGIECAKLVNVNELSALSCITCDATKSTKLNNVFHTSGPNGLAEKYTFTGYLPVVTQICR